MTTGSILMGAALLIVVALFLLRPILQAQTAGHRQQEFERPLTPRQSLEAQKEALLEEIRALEFDQETGKLPPEVYQAERAKLVSATADLLEQLDNLPPEASPIEAEIEAVVAQLRRAPAAAQLQPNGRVPQPRPQPVAAGAGPAAAARFCAQCGQPADPGDKFCAYCGTQLK